MQIEVLCSERGLRYVPGTFIIKFEQSSLGSSVSIIEFEQVSINNGSTRKKCSNLLKAQIKDSE